jgi:hypothetical protein
VTSASSAGPRLAGRGTRPEPRRKHALRRPRETEVMQFAILMAKPEHQRGLRAITCDANDGAVGGALPFSP